MAQFDYSAYYRRSKTSRNYRSQQSRFAGPSSIVRQERAYDIVLYLGCNILRTPDVAADVVTVFRALGLDFIAVAGVQFCCGITVGSVWQCRQGTDGGGFDD